MPDPTPPDYALLDRVGGASIFFPRSDERPPPDGATDHLIDVGSGIVVAARFYVRDPALPTLLYFHGNGEVASDHDDIAPFYHEIGANLFVAEFRGYGRSSGLPSIEHLVSDAHPVAGYFHALLDERGFSEQRFIMGRSLGSQPALELAARSSGRMRGLIIESGAASMRRFLARLGIEESGEAATLVAGHEEKIRSIRLPALIIHGEQDDLVPVTQAAELYDLLGETDRDLVLIPGAGHNDLLWRGMKQYFGAIQSLLRDAE